MEYRTSTISLMQVASIPQEDFDYATYLLFKQKGYVDPVQDVTYITHRAIHRIEVKDVMVSWSIADVGKGYELAQEKVGLAIKNLSEEIGIPIPESSDS